MTAVACRGMTFLETGDVTNHVAPSASVETCASRGMDRPLVVGDKDVAVVGCAAGRRRASPRSHSDPKRSIRHLQRGKGSGLRTWIFDLRKRLGPVAAYVGQPQPGCRRAAKRVAPLRHPMRGSGGQPRRRIFSGPSRGGGGGGIEAIGRNDRDP